jgi:hypothetical protein
LRRTDQIKADRLVSRAAIAISKDVSRRIISATPSLHNVPYLFPICNRKKPRAAN